MKSTPTPHTHTALTAQDIHTTFGASGSRLRFEVTIPKGTLCKKLDGGSDPWVVADLSKVTPKLDGLAYHDASHYGIRIPEVQLIDILPAGAIRNAEHQVVGSGRLTRQGAQETIVPIKHELASKLPADPSPGTQAHVAAVLSHNSINIELEPPVEYKYDFLPTEPEEPEGPAPR